MANQRPQARTANQLRAFLERGHERVVALDADRLTWLGSSAELAQALGIKRQAMTSRLRTLRSAGIADTSDAHRIVFDLGRLTELATGVRHLRLAQSTQQFRSAVSDTYEEQLSADGGVAYRHRESGQRASVRDLTRVAGYESPGSTHYHLKVLAGSSDELQPDDAGNPSECAPRRETQPLVDALAELSSLLSASGTEPALSATVLETIAEVSRSGHRLLARSPDDDATDAFSSRGSRPSDANSPIDIDYEPSRSESWVSSHVDLTRTQPHRVGTRDENASETRRPSVPPHEREHDAPGPASDGAVARIFLPLTEVVDESHPHLSPNWAALTAAAAPWPDRDLRAAITKLASQVDEGRQSGCQPIENPYAVFCAAAKRGDLEYFALRSQDRQDRVANTQATNDSSDLTYLPSASEGALRSCLIADLQRSDLATGIETLAARCLTGEDNEALVAVGRKVVLEVTGQEGLDHFDLQLSTSQPNSAADRRLSKAERQRILDVGRSRRPR